MAKSRAQPSWRSLESLFDAGALGGLTDGELLECFQTSRDAVGHDAFRHLVERHGPMVLGMCRSLVRDPHEADDAFQATFLVLVRKAGSIKRRDTIGPWLHGVAGRVARRARARAVRRLRREVEANAQIPCPVRPIGESPSVEEVVQDEIARLPEPFRAPVVLCCLEGLSYDRAARQLGVTQQTLRGRLYRARKQLALRLRGRGITAGMFTSAIEPVRISLPPLPSSLLESTVQFSVRWSSVTGLLSGAEIIPESIAGLAHGVIKTMLMQSLKLSGVVVLLAAGVLGTVVVAQQGPKTEPDSAAPAAGSLTAPAQVQTARRRIVDQMQLEAANQAAESEKNRKIEAKLDQVIDAEFPNGTTLEGILKHIKQQTTDATFPGIPIYVHPGGLQDVHAKIDGGQFVLDLKQKRVRVILNHALLATGLSYLVQDGFLTIDSRIGITERRIERLDDKLNRVLEALDRLEKVK